MRQRFNTREKELIASTLDVEVHYASGNWIAFRLDSHEIGRDSIGGYRAMGTVISDTNTKGQKSRTISKNWRMGATPGNIRPRGSDWKVT